MTLRRRKKLAMLARNPQTIPHPGAVVMQRKIEDLVKELGIQIENMCNFLPQDKVVEFTRLDATQRLKATQSAVGREDLIAMQVTISLLAELSFSISVPFHKHVPKLKPMAPSPGKPEEDAQGHLKSTAAAPDNGRKEREARERKRKSRK
jgi:hypothetical protein